MNVVAVVQTPLDVLTTGLVRRGPAQLAPKEADKVPEERLPRREGHNHKAEQ